MTWVAVGVGAVTAVGGAVASNKAGSQQASAQNKNIAMQQQALKGYTPYTDTGGYANSALNNFMGFGADDTEESLLDKFRPEFAVYGKKGGKDYGGSDALVRGVAKSVFGGKGRHTHLVGYNEGGLKAKVQAELARQKAARESEGFGAGRKNFDSSQLANDEGYQWRNKQGEQQIQRSQAARGGVFSGAAGKELARYGQGFASNEYGAANDRFNQNKMNTFNMLSQ